MKMAKSVRGMNDVCPNEIRSWQIVETVLRDVFQSFGYDEIRIPVVEYADLFKRSIGAFTDIVDKEMYIFPDRSDDLLCLRPEGTAGCVRAAIQNGLITQGVVKRLWYMGPMFRYERPQKGRQRQFNQAGLEVFGAENPDVEFELILLCARIWKELKVDRLVELEVNSIGDPEGRARYVKSLVSYLSNYHEDLDEESRRRLKTNPLRILDSKDKKIQEILVGSPQLIEFVDNESRIHFERFCASLEYAGIAFSLKPSLVRGLDYYNRTVFEWTTEALGAQGTICGGGRYDNLVEQLSGKSAPAAGCAFGLDRLLLLTNQFELIEQQSGNADIYMVAVGEVAHRLSVECAELLRAEMRPFRVVQNLIGGTMKAQMKRANKSGASFAVIIGDEEVASKSVTLKFLRGDAGQELISRTHLVSRIREIFEHRSNLM